MEYLDINYINKKFKTNKLVSALLYVYNNKDDNENKIITSIDLYSSGKNINISIINNIKILCLHLYNSRLLQYNLPTFNNSNFSKGLPSFHIVFGECMAQLVSIMLVTECLDNLLNITLEDTKLKNIIEYFINNVFSNIISLNSKVDKKQLDGDLDNLVLHLIKLSKNIIENI